MKIALESQEYFYNDVCQDKAYILLDTEDLFKIFFFFTHGKKHGSEMIQVFNNIFDNFDNSEEKC